MSSMKHRSFCHSSKYSRLTELRQQTAVRSSPRWSIPVGSVISEQRLLIFTRRPRRFCASGNALFTASSKIMYGSPVSIRAVRIRTHRLRAETVRTSSPLCGLTNVHSSSFSTAFMNLSEITTPWCRFRALRFGSPPDGRRISRNSSISGCSICR